MPTAHAVHTTSDVAVPAVVGSVPAEHGVHDVQLEALLIDEYVPLAHAEHVRSVVLVPDAVTNVPAAHVVHDVHKAWFALVE